MYQMYECKSETSCRYKDRVDKALCGPCEDLKLTAEEVERRAYIKAALDEYNRDDYPWWQGITEWNGVDGGMNPDGTVHRCIS